MLWRVDKPEGAGMPARRLLRRPISMLVRLLLRRPYYVVSVWLVLLIVSGALATQLNSRLQDSGYEVPGSSSARAAHLSAELFPAGSRQREYIAVMAAKPSRGVLLIDAARAVTAVKGQTGVQAIGSPVASADGRVALVPVVLAGSLASAQTYVPAIQASLNRAKLSTGSAELIGQAAVYDRYTVRSKQGLQLSGLISFPVMLAILLVAFLSAAAALLPLTLAAICLGVTFGGLYLISYIIQLNIFVEDTALVLGLGLSVDFSLFFVSRVREALASGAADTSAAVLLALQTTGRAVLISGLTIAVALSGLLVVGVGVFTSLATGAVVATLVAVAATLTLTPAVLVILDERLERFPIKVAVAAARNAALWRRLGDFVVRRRVRIVIVVVPAMLLLALPLTGMRIALRNISVLPPSDPVRAATDAVTRSFGPGVSTPGFVVARASPYRLAAVLHGERGLASVGSPEARGGWARASVTLGAGADSPAATNTISRLRSSLVRAFGPDAAVGGGTAEGDDLVARINARTPAVVITVLVAEMFLLTLVFGAPLIALKAAATTLLSVGAALGLMSLVFRDAGGIHFLVPLFAFATVFGLSTDYEVFFISRVREYHRQGQSTSASVKQALVRSARSITLAGTTMGVVFLAFALSPLASSQELGVAMGLGVLIDVTIVRGLLVPATLALLGERNWWHPGLAAVSRRRASRATTATPIEATIRRPE